MSDFDVLATRSAPPANPAAGVPPGERWRGYTKRFGLSARSFPKSLAPAKGASAIAVLYRSRATARQTSPEALDRRRRILRDMVAAGLKDPQALLEDPCLSVAVSLLGELKLEALVQLKDVHGVSDGEIEHALGILEPCAREAFARTSGP